MQPSDKQTYIVKKDPVGLYVQTDDLMLRPAPNLQSPSRLEAGDMVQLTQGNVSSVYLVSKKTETGVYEEIWKRIAKPSLKRRM